MEFVIYTDHDVAYLPKPNRVEVVLTDRLSPTDLTYTAFMVPIMDTGHVVIAQNQNRGFEIPGGHRDPGETVEQAAIREVWEETGCRVNEVVPIGFLRMISEAARPDEWRYPHPISYQQFFAGRVIEMVDFDENEECAAPVIFDDLNDPRLTRKSIQFFGEAARTIFGK